MPDYSNLSREELLTLAQSLSIDPSYKVLTRPAFEMNPPTEGAIIFWDIDGMGKMNTAQGYEAVNARIRAACSAIRGSKKSLVARWFSGDEFVLNCPTEDAQGAADRIVALFAAQGVAITAGVAAISPDGWKAAVERASALVQAAKSRGDRGGVHHG
jgi:GGDEF domain-containing protein